MAEIIAGFSEVAPKDWQFWNWDTLTNADTAKSIMLGGITRDMHVVFSGNFDGATVTLQGSIDTHLTADADRAWFSIVDVGGTAIAPTAAGNFVPRDSWPMVRVSASGGGASQDVDIRLARSGGR